MQARGSITHGPMGVQSGMSSKYGVEVGELFCFSGPLGYSCGLEGVVCWSLLDVPGFICSESSKF